MNGQRLAWGDPAAHLLGLYDEALPRVYGYLLSRCGQRALAEDLTAETFLAAVDAIRGAAAAPSPLTTGWLIGVARHKLSDHWRHQAREERTLRAVAAEPGPDTDDPWDARLDAMRAQDVLRRLGTHHRAALTLRYVDDLPVPEVAGLLGRTVHATEALLVRARSAFRAAYAAAETNAADGGAPDRGIPGRGSPDRSALDRGAPYRGSPDRDASDRDASDRDASDRGTPGRGALDRVAPDPGALDGGAPDRERRRGDD